MKSFLFALPLTFLGFISVSSTTSDPVEHPVPAFVRGPYLSSVTQNSIVISWTTVAEVKAKVLYGQKTTTQKVSTDESLSLVHSLTVSGLEANKLYWYRVIAGNDTTAAYEFWTAPVGVNTTFTLAAYGDTRTNHNAHVSVLRQMSLHQPRIILNSGDLVSRNTVANWDAYFADICDSTHVGQTIPMYASPGNHESGQMYYDNLFLPSNNPQKTEAYYSFDYGNIHIISVNTEIDYKKGSEQYQWLEQDLQSPAAQAATFKIVYWHRPPYSSSNHGSDMPARTVFCPLMESHGVDIVFNGHDHAYERTKPINGTTYIVTGGGGAPLYDFKTENDWTAYKEKAYHFCKLMVDNQVLRLFMIRDDGSVRDSLIINKSISTPR
jgi:predicted phosphodiesterase